jgi:ribosome maturation factor RimP
MPPRGRATGRPGRPGSPRGRGPKSQGPSDRPAVTGGPATGDLAEHRSRLTVIISPVVAKAGYDLEELAVVRMGRRYVVRVTIDRDGGVPLDDVADIARAISAELDEAESASGEFIAGEYQLEVSSPGVDRPLTLPRHWRRNIGRLVRAKVDGHTVVGRVVAATDDAVTLDVDGVERTVSYDTLGRGRVEVEFSRIDDVAEEDMVAFDDHDGDDDDRGDNDSGSNPDAEVDDES